MAIVLTASSDDGERPVLKVGEHFTLDLTQGRTHFARIVVTPQATSLEFPAKVRLITDPDKNFYALVPPGLRTSDF